VTEASPCRLFQAAHRNLAPSFMVLQGSRCGRMGQDAWSGEEMETTMKMIMTALGAAALLAGAALPASADTDLAAVAEEVARVAGPALNEFVKERRDLSRAMRFDNDKLPFGSREWWQEVERNQPGRRR